MAPDPESLDVEIGAAGLFFSQKLGQYGEDEDGSGGTWRMQVDRVDHVHVGTGTDGTVDAIFAPADEEAEMSIEFTPAQARGMAAALYDAAHQADAGYELTTAVLENGLASDDDE